MIDSRAGGYAEIFNMDAVGIYFYQLLVAGSKAYFFKGEEAASYGGNSAKAPGRNGSSA